jgi:hypothetical protein
MLATLARWARNSGWTVTETEDGFIFEREMAGGRVRSAVWGNGADSLCIETSCAADRLTITERLELDRLHSELRQAVLSAAAICDRLTWSSNVAVVKQPSGDE